MAGLAAVVRVTVAAAVPLRPLRLPSAARGLTDALAAAAGTVSAEATRPARNTLRISIELVLTFLACFHAAELTARGNSRRPAGSMRPVRNMAALVAV